MVTTHRNLKALARLFLKLGKKIAFLQDKFPQLQHGEITIKIREVEDINKRMKKITLNQENIWRTPHAA